MNNKAPLVFAAALALGLGISISAQAEGSNAPAPEFKINDAGQTFGPITKNGPRPDFAPIPTDAGVQGWVKADDWDPPRDASGAPSHDHVVTPDKNGDIKIPVYAFDGKTKIGEATIAHVGSE